MGLRRPRLVGLTFSLALVAVLAFVLPASASAARVLYASGHPIDTNRLAKFGGNTLTATFDGCSDSEWASALARTDFDVLINGEDAGRICAISPGTQTAIANYVSGGGRFIQTGAHGDQADVLNDIFGFSTTETDSSSDQDLFGSIQPSATGTPFQGGPPTLTTPSQTNLLGGTPGTTIYSGPEGVFVFTAPFGAGTVTYLGWDLCGEPDECGNTPGVEDDWYRVLDRAGFTNAFTIDAITRNKKKGTATITVSVFNPGELIASGKGAKTSAGGAVISKSVGAGKATLLIKAKGKKRKKLNRKGKAKLNLAITYTPTRGSANTQPAKVKLKKKLKRK